MVYDRGTVDKQWWSVYDYIGSVVNLWRRMVNDGRSVYNDVLFLLFTSLEFFDGLVVVCFGDGSLLGRVFCVRFRLFRGFFDL